MAKPLAWLEKDKIYARSQAIQRIFDISRESVNQWIKKYKLPVEKDGRTTKYNLKDVVQWKIDKEISDAVRGMGEIDDGVEFANLPMEVLNHTMKAYATKKLKHESSIKEIQEKVEKGKFIPADRVDYNMAQLAGVFISTLKELRQVLPVKLENKDAKVIEDLLDDYFESLVIKMQKSV